MGSFKAKLTNFSVPALLASTSFTQLFFQSLFTSFMSDYAPGYCNVNVLPKPTDGGWYDSAGNWCYSDNTYFDPQGLFHNADGSLYTEGQFYVPPPGVAYTEDSPYYVPPSIVEGNDDGWGDFVEQEEEIVRADDDRKDDGPHGPALYALMNAIVASFKWKLVQRSKVQPADFESARGIMNTLYAESQRGNKNVVPSPVREKKECQVCSTAFGRGEDDAIRFTMGNCQHQNTCRDCVKGWITSKVGDKDVLPWIRCPEPGCAVPMSSNDLFDCGLSTEEAFDFARTFCQKHLARSPWWVECKEKKCCGGFLLPESKVEMPARTISCPACATSQSVVKKKEELDDEFKKMFADGKIRNCPKCNEPTFKEFGVCNVINCGKCSIWWNWKTRKTGNSSDELKNKARQEGTLWEAGELEFQQKLERENPKEFQALLERNGIEFKKNYVRGGH